MPTKIGDVILYDVADIAKRLDTSESTVRRYIRNGVLKGRKMGRRWFVAEENIQAYFREFGISPRPPVDASIEELPDQWPGGAPPSRPPQTAFEAATEPVIYHQESDLADESPEQPQSIEEVLATLKPGLNIHSLVELFDDAEPPQPISLADLLGEDRVAHISDDWRTEIEDLIRKALELKREARRLEETYGQ